MQKKKILTRILTGMLSVITIISNSVPMYASVTETQTTSEEGSQNTDVLYEQDSTYEITIPKTIVLGEDKTSSYAIKVEGDIASDKSVYVSPVDNVDDKDGINFYMKDQSAVSPKADVLANVTQEKTTWLFNEVAEGLETTDNTVSATDLSSGSWKGIFAFEISMHSLIEDSEEVSLLSLSVDELSMGSNSSYQVNAYYEGEEVNDYVSWESDNENITVNNGLVETTASAQVGDTATVTVSANTVSTYALEDESQDNSISANFTVTIVDIVFSAEGEEDIITSLDIIPGESKEVEATIVPGSVSGTVSWSTTSTSGLNIVSNGNIVTIKVAEDMPTGSEYDLVSTYGAYSRLLKIKIVPDHKCIYSSEVTKEANCTEEGITTYTCDICGDNYTEPISKLGHSYENGVCSICGETVDSRVAINNLKDGGTYPTNTFITVSDGDKLSVNGVNADIVNGEYVFSEEGSFIVTYTDSEGNSNSVSITISDSQNTSIYDIVSNKTYTIGTTIEASEDCTLSLNINGSNVSGEKYTFNEEGTFTIVETDSEGNKTTATIVIRHTHTYEGTVTKESTCTENGIKIFNCNECDVSYEETLALSNHIFAEDFTVDVEATCTEVGSKSKHCTNVDCNEVTEVTEIEKLSHIYDEGVETISPSYTDEGVKTFTCINDGCNDSYTEPIPKLVDNIPASGSITVSNNVWKNFLNTITFNLFFNETQDVVIEATDSETGVQNISYYVANDVVDEANVASLEWIEYTDKFSISPNNQYVIYARIIDNNNNITYINSDGIVLDDVKPTIDSSIVDGETYDIGTTITIGEGEILKIDGVVVEVTDENTYTFNEDGNHTVSVVDKAGNESDVITITIHKHTYTSTVKTSATCTDDGVMSYKCSCGDSYTEAIPALGLEHEYENGVCINCGEKALEAGLYNADGVMLCSWEKSGIDVETDYYISSDSISNHYQTTKSSAYYVITNKYPKTTKIILPESVSSLGNYAFYDCDTLTDIIIPNSVTSIGKVAFGFCTSLTSITIPNSVTELVSGSTFYKCSNLTKVNLPNTISVINNAMFQYCSSLSNITIPESVISIDKYAFDGCTNLNNLVIPSSVSSIGYRAFSNCTNLTNIVIPSSVTEFGGQAFVNTPWLTNQQAISENGLVLVNNILIDGVTATGDVVLADSVVGISDYAFWKCEGLTSIVLSENIPSIGQHTFYNCINLANIEISDSVTSIGEYAFYNCDGLSSIEIPENVTSIGSYAFQYCNNLSDVTLSNGLESIGRSSFENCTSLTDITIPSSVTTIRKYAFRKTGLTSAKFEVTSGWYVNDDTGYYSISSSTLKWSAVESLTSTYVEHTITRGL